MRLGEVPGGVESSRKIKPRLNVATISKGLNFLIKEGGGWGQAMLCQAAQTWQGDGVQQALALWRECALAAGAFVCVPVGQTI